MRYYDLRILFKKKDDFYFITVSRFKKQSLPFLGKKKSIKNDQKSHTYQNKSTFGIDSHIKTFKKLRNFVQILC